MYTEPIAFNETPEETKHLIRQNQPTKHPRRPAELGELFFYFLFFCIYLGGGIALVVLFFGSDPAIIATFVGIFIVIAIAMSAYCGINSALY